MKDFTSQSQEHAALGNDRRSRQDQMPSRREFLKLCSGVPALWLPTSFTVAPLAVGQQTPRVERPLAVPLDYRITPHYPEGVPLDDLMRKVNSELDDFPTETYAEEIEGIIARWGEALQQSPPDFQPIEGSLSLELTAAPLMASAIKKLRSAPPP